MPFKIRSIFRSGKESTQDNGDPASNDLDQGSIDAKDKSSTEPSTKGQGKVAGDTPPQLKETVDTDRDSVLQEDAREAKKVEPAALRIAPEKNLEKSTSKKVEKEQDDGDDRGQSSRAPRIRPKNIEELLMKAVPERAQFAGENLKTLLTSSVLFDIVPSGRKYLFEWGPQGCTVVERKADPKNVEPACTIQIHEKDLMKIADGDLNPQILMLSHKAKIFGHSQSATYIFNLIAPPANI